MILPLIFAIVVTTPAPSASPSPAPSATPVLKTIASVRSNSRCAEIVTHANGAITAALTNDTTLNHTIGFLQFANFDDGNLIHREQAKRALGDYASQLMKLARSGDNEVKRLRKIADQEKTTDPKGAKELKSFADELGGALWRQQTVARDLNGFLAYEDMKDMSQPDESQQQSNMSLFGVPDPFTQTPSSLGQPVLGLPPVLGSHDPNDPTFTQYARRAANDLVSRLPGILTDESDAASHVDAAMSGGGC